MVVEGFAETPGETPGKASASGQEAPGGFVKLGSLLPQSLQPDVPAPAPSLPWCSPWALCDPICQASSAASGKSLQPSSLCSHLENGAKTVPCVLGSSRGHTVHRPYWGLMLPRLSPSVCVSVSSLPDLMPWPLRDTHTHTHIPGFGPSPLASLRIAQGLPPASCFPTRGPLLRHLLVSSLALSCVADPAGIPWASVWSPPPALSLVLTPAPWIHSSGLHAPGWTWDRGDHGGAHPLVDFIQLLMCRDCARSSETSPSAVLEQMVPPNLSQGGVQGQTREEEAVKTQACRTEGMRRQESEAARAAGGSLAGAAEGSCV